MKWWKKCPLLIILAVSGLILTVISAVNLKGVYREYEAKTFLTPVMAAFFQGAKEGNYPWSDAGMMVKEKEAREETGQEMAEEEAVTESEAEKSRDMARESEEEQQESAGQADGLPESAAAEMTDTEETEETKEAAEIQGTAETLTEPEDKTYEFVRVEEDYFQDALFIGDSRTQGLFEYGGMEDYATFYCKTSLTVYDLFKKDKAFIREEGESITLTQALTKHQFGKIYLMVGINEMGTGTPDTFFEEYARVVSQIRELQPDAVIFVEGIMRVASGKNASDPIFNNAGVDIRNEKIATLADNQSIFYIDVNEVVCDENGNLHDDWTFDQIHLKAKYYEIWKNFLMDHGIVKEAA